MVFSSLEFLYLFLPPVLVVFLLLRQFRWETGIIWWLILASLAFYAWWSPPHVILIMTSVILNFALHRLLLKRRNKLILGIGIAGNLATLGYFKYADFILENFNYLSDSELPMLKVVLPLAISFFTFQQISFLYDTWKGDVSDCNFSKYCLFVVFFPQLIAGPIVLQKQTIPQFRMAVFEQKLFINLAVGSTLFTIGLFKKIVLADGMAPIVSAVFSLADSGESVPMAAAWMGTIAYTFQIYFDFSGYCDMALGLARLFGIRLPINFNSPYKAMSIVDFWNRWHMTLSAFLKKFLYIPLGGNRKGTARRYVNLGITMLLGGLWHGASWNFVFWGLLHGVYLSINHGWRAFGCNITKPILPHFHPILTRTLARCITLLAVMIAWVPFRAETLGGAIRILEGMSGRTLWSDPDLWTPILETNQGFVLQALALAMLVLMLPNSIELVRNYRPVLDVRGALESKMKSFPLLPMWRPTMGWASVYLGVCIIALIQVYRLESITEFIYFNF